MKSVSKQYTDRILLAEFMDFSQDANLLFYFIFRNGKYDLSLTRLIFASWIGKYILSFPRYFIIITIFPQQKMKGRKSKK